MSLLRKPEQTGYIWQRVKIWSLVFCHTASCVQVHASGTSFSSFLPAGKNWAQLAMRPKSSLPSSKAAGGVTQSVVRYSICPQDTVKCLTLGQTDRLFEEEFQIHMHEGQSTLWIASAKVALSSLSICCHVELGQRACQLLIHFLSLFR